MSYLKKYLALNHRYFFDGMTVDEWAQAVEEKLNQKEIQNQWVYVCHSHPVKFALSFLAVLDRGGFPICLASDKNVEFDSVAFIENEWVPGLSPRTTVDSKAKYAVPTSGTTGRPKLCEFYLEKALQNATAHALGFSLESHLQIIQTLPVHHSYGVIAYILAPLVVGCSVNFCPGMIGLRSLKKDKAPKDSVMHVSPSQARFIIRDKVSVPQLQKITIGGGALTIDEIEKLQEVLPEAEIFVSYGLTEAGPRVTAGKFHKALKTNFNLKGFENWLGYAIKDVQLKLIETDAEGAGRLCVKSPYLKINPLPQEKDGDWLITRDRVLLIEDSVFFLSREDDLLKYGGVTIYPKDIESVVRHWPGVTDVIVLKESDPMYGDHPLLMIEGNITLEKANELLAQDISQASAFKEIFIQEKFPRQSLEKIDRKKLLDLARSSRS